MASYSDRQVTGSGRNARLLPGAAGLLLLAVLAACSAPDTGPYVLCTVRDGGGGEWIARDINPLSAQERALQDCGAQSRIPDSCVAASCDRQW